MPFLWLGKRKCWTSRSEAALLGRPGAAGFGSGNHAYMPITWNCGSILGTSKKLPGSMEVHLSRLFAMPFRLGVTSFSLSSVSFLFLWLVYLWLSSKNIAWNPACTNLKARAKRHKQGAKLHSSCLVLLSTLPSAFVIYRLLAQFPSWPSFKTPFFTNAGI